MKKVYLLLTAICLAALTGCIKEEYTLEETAITVNVSTRATGTASTEQGDGIKDVNVWAFKYTETIEDALKNIGEDFTISYEGKDNETTVLKWKGKNETEAIEKVRITNAATAWSRVPAMAAWSSVDVHLQFMACTTTEKYILVAVINQGQFGTIKVGSETKTLGRYTTYSDLINAKFVAPAARGELMDSNPGNGSGADPDYMPISHWTTFDLTTAHAGNTHPNTCLEVPMPVYRALAKTQLLVAKSDANSTVTIKNVTLGSSAYPTEGALLSAAVGQVVTVNNTTKAADFKAPGDTTPQWYVSSVAKSSTTVEKDILTAESVTVDKPLTEDEHKAATADGDYTKFTPITSYFLYENKGGNDGEWNKASKNDGYYMAVTYDLTPDKDNDDITENVWLPAVVRNHDIQVRALVNAGGKMTLTFNVQPWTDVTQTWNYTDVASLAAGGELEWADGTNKGSLETVYKKDENGEDTEVVDYRFRNITVYNTTPATCTFHIDTPTGATWQAMFASGDIAAFEFVDENLQSLGNTTYGNVGTKATLRIRATKPADEINRTQSAFLDIVVKTADGRIIKVNNLMKDGDSGEIRYKMVQVK